MPKEDTDRYHIVKINFVDESTGAESWLHAIVSARSVPQLFWAVSLYTFEDREIKKIEIVTMNALFIQGGR